MQQLEKTLKRHEGFKDEVYLDSLGFPTCGWGHHLWVGSKVPLECCEAFFKQDVAQAIRDFQTIARSMRKNLDTTRSRVIVMMIFQMGLQRVMQFKKMWTAIHDKDWERASQEMLDSKWAEQTKARAVELALIMKTGKEVV